MKWVPPKNIGCIIHHSAAPHPVFCILAIVSNHHQHHMMSASSTNVPLSARPKDLAMFVYFASHVPTTALMDLVPLYPSFMAPYIKPLTQFNSRCSSDLATYSIARHIPNH